MLASYLLLEVKEVSGLCLWAEEWTISPVTRYPPSLQAASQGPTLFLQIQYLHYLEAETSIPPARLERGRAVGREMCCD